MSIFGIRTQEEAAEIIAVGMKRLEVERQKRRLEEYYDNAWGMLWEIARKREERRRRAHVSVTPLSVRLRRFKARKARSRIGMKMHRSVVLTGRYSGLPVYIANILNYNLSEHDDVMALKDRDFLRMEGVSTKSLIIFNNWRSLHRPKQSRDWLCVASSRKFGPTELGELAYAA